ncbi:MAG: HNH endonuclease [Clostridiales bacterium]|nr:HNH endonuclease [Clostridiales bacterium]
MEEQIRLAAFEWLREQVQFHGDVLPRAILEQGFNFRDERVTLIGPQGIWKPKILRDMPISITTAPGSPYSNSFTTDGLLLYKYRGDDPFHRDNVGLREAMHRKAPLIYFYGVARGKYFAVWPVYIVSDNPNRFTFTVAADDMNHISHFETSKEVIYGKADDERIVERQYVTRNVNERLHQRLFREVVIHAYRERCAFCNLRHTQLLDAAHIIPDADTMGEPIVNNGLSLCKIHHAAYDSNMIGVTPDYGIVVRDDIMREQDGPMLKHGIQALHKKSIILPKNIASWPDKDRLSLRFKQFRG